MPDIRVSSGTNVICTSCGNTTAEVYYLKRSRSRFALLCFREGAGCWERSSKPLCSHLDEDQINCQLLAEWEITYGEGVGHNYSCSGHLGTMMSDLRVNNVYPMEE